MKRFNEWLALKITSAVSTMYCAYLFAILAVFGFPYGALGLAPYVQWLSQTFIQLTMLSVIMVGQELLNKQQKEHHKHIVKHLKKRHDNPPHKK